MCPLADFAVLSRLSDRHVCVQMIISLIDNWDQTNGVDKYVKWSGTATGHDQFFSDTNCMTLYRNTVATIINRVNTISGRR